MTRRIVLEVAVTTADEARAAADAGADRVELCSGLEVGGLTPSIGLFLEVRAAVEIPVYVLLRPRTGDFTYTGREFAAIAQDARWMLQHGADGIVCGALTAGGRIDHSRCRTLAELANGNAVFHRAFDFVPDRLAAQSELITLGFERVLTSGGAASAWEGRRAIADLVHRGAGRIGILPAGGIRPDHVAGLLRETGCDQVHASLRGPIPNSTLNVNSSVAAQMGGTATTDAALVARMRDVLDQFEKNRPDGGSDDRNHGQ